MAASTPQQRAVAQLYTALFNRAPDADGFGFWVQAVDNGASLNALAQSMMGSPEAASLYPAGQTDAEFVASYYTSVFGRSPDAEGLQFWAAALAAQGGAGTPAARAALTLQINAVVSTPLGAKPDGMSDAAYAQSVADRARFANKVEFGVYFAAELKSNDVTLARSSLALVTDSPASITAATNAANGIVLPPPADPSITITVADAAGAIATRFAAYGHANAKVDATGMTAPQLSAVAAAVDKIAVDGITGALTLSNAQTAAELTALLGTKTAQSATVGVDAASMSNAKIAAVGNGAAKVDTLVNLPTLSLSNANITDSVTAGLFAVSAPGSLRLAASGASAAELALIAANPGKILSITGNISLNSQVDTSVMTDLLAARAGGGLTAIHVDPAGMSTDQLTVVTGNLAAIAGISLHSGVDAATIAAVLAAPGMSTATVNVSLYDMTPGQIEAVADGAGALQQLRIDANIEAGAISTLLSAPAMGPVAVSVFAASMSAAQLEAVGSNVANVDTLSDLPTLQLNDALMVDGVSTALMSKATGFSVAATGASANEVTALLANLSKVAAGGIDGALTLGIADLAVATAGNALSAKLASSATLVVAGTTGRDIIDVSSLSKGVRVDGNGGGDRIVLGNGADTVFIANQGATQNGATLNDTDTSKILTIANFTASDVIRFSSGADAFGNGITLQEGAIVRNGTMTNAVDVLTLGDVVSIANSVRTLVPTPESTSASPKIFMVHSYFYNNGVPAGGLANKTFFVLNDGVSEITLNDTIFAVENFINTIGSAEAKFEAGI